MPYCVAAVVDVSWPLRHVRCTIKVVVDVVVVVDDDAVVRRSGIESTVQITMSLLRSYTIFITDAKNGTLFQIKTVRILRRIQILIEMCVLVDLVGTHDPRMSLCAIFTKDRVCRIWRRMMLIMKISLFSIVCVWYACVCLCVMYVRYGIFLVIRPFWNRTFFSPSGTYAQE